MDWCRGGARQPLTRETEGHKDRRTEDATFVLAAYRGKHKEHKFSLKKKLGIAKVICKPPVLVPKTAQESSLSKLGEMAHV